jgi:hypothetical protein
MRKAGEMAKGGGESGVGRRGKKNAVGRHDSIPSPTLDQIGITRDQSSNWQKLAAIPEAEFEKKLKEPALSTESVLAKERRQALIEVQATLPGGKVDDDSLWVWGRLTDWERSRARKRTQRELLEGMVDTMQADVLRLAPSMAAWLGGFVSAGKELVKK